MVITIISTEEENILRGMNALTPEKPKFVFAPIPDEFIEVEFVQFLDAEYTKKYREKQLKDLGLIWAEF